MPSTVAACQHPVTDLDPAANLDTIETRLAGLPERVDVAVFPEYALTGFVPDARVHDAALERDGPELARLDRLARDHDTAVLVGFAEAAPDAYYNTLGYVTADGNRTHYRKRHLWDAEADWVDPGTERVVLDTPVGPTGLVTCYDLNFVVDSAAFREEGVDALLVAGAWPAAHSENWRLLARARALDGVRWVVAAGRTGQRDVDDAPTATYAGRSMVVRPDGSVAAALNRRPDDLLATLDPDELAELRDFVGSA